MIFVQYMKIQNMIWRQTPGRLCNKRLQWTYCQKVPIMFVKISTTVYLLINSLKAKASVENIHLWYENKLPDVYAIHWYDFINGCLLQPMLHINHSLLPFADITDPLLNTVTLFFRLYNHTIQTWAIKAASHLTRWILKSHVQYTIESAATASFKFHEVT